MAETNWWQQVWSKEKTWPTGRPNTNNSLPSNVENDLRSRGLITDRGQMYDPHGDDYIGPSNTGEAKTDLASEAAMFGLTYAAVKNPWLALEAVGADYKSFNDQSLYQIDRLRMANALGSVNRKVKGARRIGLALKNIIENPRQAELAGTGIVGDVGRVSDDFTPSNVFQAKSLEKIAGSGPAPGALQLEGLRERVLSGASQSNLEKYLNTDYSKALNKKYKDGRGLYYSPKTLSKNKELLNQIVEKHENIGRLHFNYKMSNTDVNQRKLYDEIGRNYFNNAALVYGNNKARDALVNVSHWLTKDHWHHIFGNKEVGEGLLSVIAQDPLVGVNIARHMHKLKLHSSGIAENIAIIKEFGHKQFHDFLRAAGFEGKFGRSAPLAINEHLQEVSKLATKGTTYTEKAGPGLAGKVVEADPSYVNEIFTLLDEYAKVNTFMKKLMKKGNVWFDPVSKKIVPKNTEGAIMFNFRAQRYGKDTPIEFLNERIGRVTDIYELNK